MKSCSEINEMMSLYIDEMLDDTSRNELDQHIHTCPSCKNTLDELIQVVELCRETPDEDLPFDFKETLHERLVMEKTREDNSKKVIKLFGRFAAIGSSAAAILILVIAFQWITGNGFYSTKSYDSTTQENVADNAQAVELKKDKGNSGKAEDNGKKSIVEDKASAPMNYSLESQNKEFKSYQDAIKDSSNGSSNPPVDFAGKEADAARSSDGAVSTATVTFNKVTGNTDTDAHFSLNAITNTSGSNVIAFNGNGAAKIEQKSTSIKIYHDSPESQAERLKTLSIEFGGETVNPDNTSEVGTKAISSSTITQIVKIPNTQVVKFEDALKSGFGASNIEIGNLTANDITNKILELNIKLNELNSKIGQNQNNSKVPAPEETDKLTAERDKVRAEVEGLQKNSEYTYVTLYIYKK